MKKSIKASLSAEGKKVLQLLTTKYAMQEDKALQLIKEVLSVALSPVMTKAIPDLLETQTQKKLNALQRRYDSLMAEKAMRGFER